MVERIQVRLETPGTRENTYFLCNEWQCLFGVSNPMNLGTCKILLVGIDANGNAMGDYPLLPGYGIGRYIPPTGAFRLGVVAARDALPTDVGLFEYDAPNS